MFVFTTTFLSINAKLYKDKLIYETQSKYQRIAITKRGDDLRLFLNGNLQFSSVDEYRYHELLVHPALSLVRTPERVLVIGGGDGLGIRELVKNKEIKDIFLVDLDEIITDLAINYDPIVELNENALLDKRVKIINEDGYKYLENNNQLFNLIIADLPDPNNETVNKLYTAEFYTLVSRSLAKDGVFVTQATSPFFSNNAFWIISDTIDEVFSFEKQITGYIPSFGEWGFIVASNYDFIDSWEDIPKKFPKDLRYLDNDVFSGIDILSEDITKQYDGRRINSLTEQILFREYILDYSRYGFY